jgi:peptidoglycan/LPS O-acetylase OafA/YrhL
MFGADWAHVSTGGTNSYNFNPPAWSLGTELTFYALAPFIARLRSGFWLAFAITAVTVIVSWLARIGTGGWSNAFTTFPQTAWLFLLGVTAYRGYALVQCREHGPVVLRYGGYCLLAVIGLYVAVSLAALGHLPPFSKSENTGDVRILVETRPEDRRRPSPASGMRPGDTCGCRTLSKWPADCQNWP